MEIIDRDMAPKIRFRSVAPGHRAGSKRLRLPVLIAALILAFSACGLTTGNGAANTIGESTDAEDGGVSTDGETADEDSAQTTPDGETEAEAPETTEPPIAIVEQVVFGPQAGSPAPGLDPDLDALWDRCRDGAEGGGVCDELFWAAPPGQGYRAYELFGGTCGGRSARVPCVETLGGSTDQEIPIGRYTDRLGHWDTSRIPPTGSPAPGRNPELDTLWSSCGTGSEGDCVALNADSNVGSDYEAYGASCGGRKTIPSVSCAVVLLDPAERVPPGSPPPGLNPDLDALWVNCGPGRGEACFTLTLEADIHPYAFWGATCGGHVEPAIVLTDCIDYPGGQLTTG